MEQWIASYKGLVLLPAIEDVKVSPMKKPGKDQVSHILLSTVKYPTRTTEMTRTNCPGANTVTRLPPKSVEPSKINMLGSPAIPTMPCTFSRPKGN